VSLCIAITAIADEIVKEWPEQALGIPRCLNIQIILEEIDYVKKI
jgi:hypothetical protein